MAKDRNMDTLKKIAAQETKTTKQPVATEESPAPDCGLKKDEYLDISNNMRTYINMRFAQLTLYFAITAVLLNVLMGKDFPKQGMIVHALKIGGLLITFVFFVMEERASDIYHMYKNRAKELEKQLGFLQYSKREERKYLSATNAVRVLFIFMIILWMMVTFL